MRLIVDEAPERVSQNQQIRSDNFCVTPKETTQTKQSCLPV